MGIGQGPVETQAVVWGMWVAPGFRRRGYGEQLLAAVPGHCFLLSCGLD